MTALSPIINQKFKGDIWRLEIDELSDNIFIEVRDHQQKQASFASLNLANGNLNFIDLTTPERWLTGIEAACDGVLLLHNYQSATGPVHKGVIAVDAITGETLWSNYNFAFDSLSDKGPLLYDTRIQPRKLFLADVKTGATSRVTDALVYGEAINQIIAPELLPAELSPVEKPVFGNSIHYLKHNNFRIVSLHTEANGLLNQYLYILDDTGIVYEDLLNPGIQKLQPEAFILHKNRLIYIKNKAVLTILSL